MATWTKGILLGHMSAAKVAEALTETYGAAVKVERAQLADHGLLLFKENTGRNRVLHVFENGLCRDDHARIYKGDATYISCADSGDSCAFVRGLVERFGGFFLPTDCFDKEPWEEIATPAEAPSPA